jgi:hypothetical protein
MNKIKNKIKADIFFKDNVRISFDGLTRRLRVDLTSGTYLEASQHVFNVLGIIGEESRVKRKIIGKYNQRSHYESRVDVDAEYRTLWIYSNACAHRRVGGTRTPLLRTIPVIERDMYTQAYIHYQKPYYIPVSQNYFPALELLITDTAGRKIPFQAGQVIATLHFRRAAP